jgi:hypothetical protein
MIFCNFVEIKEKELIIFSNDELYRDDNINSALIMLLLSGIQIKKAIINLRKGFEKKHL